MVGGMAIVAPIFVTCEASQQLDLPVTVPADTTGWAATFSLRAYAGQTALVTKTIAGGGITNAPGASSSTLTVSLSASDLALTPGLYEWTLERTTTPYPIVDRSGFLITAASATASPCLTNLAEYLAYQGAGTPGDTDAQQALILLADAEEFLQVLCNRRFGYASQTLYLDSHGTRELVIPRTPVQSITSVKVDAGGLYGRATNAFADDALTEGTDYVVRYDDPDNPTWSRSGILTRVGTTWPVSRERPRDLLGYHTAVCRGCVKVVGVFGYSLVPIPIKRAVWDLATWSREAALRGRLPTSQSAEGYSRSFGSLEDEAKRLNGVRAVVAKYTRYVI